MINLFSSSTKSCSVIILAWCVRNGAILWGVLSWVLFQGAVAGALPGEKGPGVRVDLSKKTVILQTVSPSVEMTLAAAGSDNDKGVQLRVKGFRLQQGVVVEPVFDPSRIIVDLSLESSGFKTVLLPVGIGNVSDFRLGHHPDKVRLVLGIAQGPPPRTRLDAIPGGFILYVGDGADVSPSTPAVPTDDERAAVEEGASLPSHRQTPPAVPSPSLPSPGEKGLNNALALSRSGKWQEAIDALDGLIREYPDSSFAEQAWFLLPDMYVHLYGETLNTHVIELTDRYRDVMGRFPESRYMPKAMLGLADLYHRLENYAEALGYYHLVIQNTPKHSPMALKAMVQTAEIYYLKKRITEAKTLLQQVIDTGVSSAVTGEALVKMGQILYDEKKFHQSLELLQRLVAMDKENMRRFPDVSMYMGNNHFQLGHYTRARKLLFQFYNSSPDRPDSALTLARIGDTYIGDGRTIDAVKLFSFIVQRYPATRGAHISWLRLAEQQELHPEVTGLSPLSPRQIYEKVRGFFMARQENDPLAILATLKLGVLDYNEGHLAESLRVLKTFFGYNPEGVLRENGMLALTKTLTGLVDQAWDKKDFSGVIALYEQEQPSFDTLFLSEPVLFSVARSYLELARDAQALVIFKKMDPLLKDEDKPDDLLYYLGRHYFEQHKIEATMDKLGLLLKKNPQSQYAGEACRIMAECLVLQKKYDRAISMFDDALNYDVAPCQRAKMLIGMADSAMKISAEKKALAAADKALDLYTSCHGLAGYMGDQIGDLYFSLGYLGKALTVFTQVSEMKQEQVKTVSLQYKMARCLERLGRHGESMDLLQTIAGGDDPFWSKLAREQIASARFAGELKAAP